MYVYMDVWAYSPHQDVSSMGEGTLLCPHNYSVHCRGPNTKTLPDTNQSSINITLQLTVCASK